MADFTLEIKGFDKASQKVAMLLTEVREGVVKAVRESTEQAKDIALSRVPRDTGELASTIRSRYTASGLTAYLEAGYGLLPRGQSGRSRIKQIRAAYGGGKGAYANDVEFGTKHAPAHPFLVPAIEAVRPGLLLGVERAMVEGIQKAANRNDTGMGT